MSYASEQKIRDLSSKIVSIDDLTEFEPAVRELKEALHQHISEVRDKVADLALVIVSEEKSKAA